MNDQIEQKIQAKGLDAPRVTPVDIEAEIVNTFYFTAAEGVDGAVAAGGSNSEATVLVDVDLLSLRLLTFCVLRLRNGCKVVGINHGPVDPAGFNATYGQDDAREDAIRQVWPLLGFRLRDQLAADAAADPADDAPCAI